MAKQRINKAIGGKHVWITSDTWNKVAGLAEWISKLSAAPPLMLADTPAGPLLSVRPGGTSPPLIQLSSAATFTPSGGSPITLGGGRYVGTVWDLPTADATLSGNLSDADLGSAGTTCLVYNVRENGKSTRNLVTTAGILPQYFFGYARKPYSDGTPVYAIDGLQGGC